MNKFNLLNSIPIIIVTCLLFSLIFGAGFLWPQRQDLKELQKNIKEKKEEFQQQEQYFSTLSQIKKELEEYDEALSKINSALPDGPSLPSLFSFLQKASSQSGLISKAIGPFAISFPETSPSIKKIQFSLQVFGPYPSLKNFLSILENSARLIEVENISFSSPKTGTLFTFNLGIVVNSY